MADEDQGGAVTPTPMVGNTTFRTRTISCGRLLPPAPDVAAPVVEEESAAVPALEDLVPMPIQDPPSGEFVYDSDGGQSGYGSDTRSDEGLREAEGYHESNKEPRFLYDVYLSHDHGDENKDRIQELLAELREHEMEVFELDEGKDEDWMVAMRKSRVVLCGVTEKYMDKVAIWTNMPESESRAKKEFAYACKVVPRDYILPVVLDGTQDWGLSGPVGRVLSSRHLETSLELDMGSFGDSGPVIQEIVDTVKELGSRRQEEEEEEASTVIEALQQLLNEEREGIRKEKEDATEIRRGWLEDQLADLEKYKLNLEDVFKLDGEVRQGVSQQEQLKRDAEELSHKYEQERKVFLEQLLSEQRKQEERFKDRLQRRKQQRQSKTPTAVALEDGKEEKIDGESATENVALTEEEKAERERHEAEEKAERERLAKEQDRQIKEEQARFDKQRQELEELRVKTERVEKEIESKKKQLEEAQREKERIDKLMPDVSRRLKLLQQQKEVDKEIARLAKTEHDLDQKQAKQRRLEAEIKAKEAAFLEKAISTEQRRIDLAKLEKKQREEKLRMQKEKEQVILARARKLKEDDQKKRDEAAMYLSQQQERYYAHLTKKLEEDGKQRLQAHVPRKAAEKKFRPRGHRPATPEEDAEQRPWRKKTNNPRKHTKVAETGPSPYAKPQFEDTKKQQVQRSRSHGEAEVMSMEDDASEDQSSFPDTPTGDPLPSRVQSTPNPSAPEHVQQQAPPNEQQQPHLQQSRPLPQQEQQPHPPPNRRKATNEAATANRPASAVKPRPPSAEAHRRDLAKKEKEPPIIDFCGKTVTTLKTTVETELKLLPKTNVLAMHFTTEKGAKCICNSGVRLSADGQGGGGFYVVQARFFNQVLKSQSAKFDREAYLRACVALFGLVNANGRPVDSMKVLLLIKIPASLIEEVPIDEEDDRAGMCPLHYVPLWKIRDMGLGGDLNEDGDGNVLLKGWEKKIVRWYRIFNQDNTKTPNISIQDIKISNPRKVVKGPAKEDTSAEGPDVESKSYNPSAARESIERKQDEEVQRIKHEYEEKARQLEIEKQQIELEKERERIQREADMKVQEAERRREEERKENERRAEDARREHEKQAEAARRENDIRVQELQRQLDEAKKEREKMEQDKQIEELRRQVEDMKKRDAEAARVQQEEREERAKQQKEAEDRRLREVEDKFNREREALESRLAEAAKQEQARHNQLMELKEEGKLRELKLQQEMNVLKQQLAKPLPLSDVASTTKTTIAPENPNRPASGTQASAATDPTADASVPRTSEEMLPPKSGALPPLGAPKLAKPAVGVADQTAQPAPTADAPPHAQAVQTPPPQAQTLPSAMTPQDMPQDMPNVVAPAPPSQQAQQARPETVAKVTPQDSATLAKKKSSACTVQ